MLRHAWFVARKDVASMLRMKETILWTFVMPPLFFWFIGTVTGGFGRVGGSQAAPDPLFLEGPAEGGFLVDALAARLAEQDFYVYRERADRPPSRTLTLPAPADGHADLTASVLAGEQALLAFESTAEGNAGSLDRLRVGRAVYGLLAELAILAQEGRDVTPDALAELHDAPRALRLDVRPAGKRKVIPNGFEQTVPGTTVMFTMLILLTSGSILLVMEREQGLLRRLASTPVPRGAVVLGKWSGKMALGLVQLAFALLLGVVVFDLRLGAAWPAVLAVLVAWAGFNASLGILLANLARSEGQMAGIGVVTSMLMGALGGCWWPIEVTPQWMQRLALWLPTGWAMDALHRLLSFGEAAGAAAPHLLALVVGALVLGWAGARTFRYV